jgi:predicted TIM-barrel fold metal-dependent hydrolase
MTPYGLIGTLFARGAVNSAALIALLEGGSFSTLSDLRVVVTAHAIGGLAMAAGLSAQSLNASGAAALLRKHVYIDTTLCHPALIRMSVDLLGAENVIAGSDWPITGENPLRDPLMEAMQKAELSLDEQRAIAAGNCKRLLGIH